MKTNEKAIQAKNDGEVHYCPSCETVQPIELTKFDPDSDDEPDLIVCLICGEAIGFIQNM